MDRRKICGNKSIPNQDEKRCEKLIRKFDYNSPKNGQKTPPLHLDLKVLHRNQIPKKIVQNVLVTIKPRSRKNIYFANTSKASDKSYTQQGVGDHKSVKTIFSYGNRTTNPIDTSIDQISSKLTELNFIAENEDHQHNKLTQGHAKRYVHGHCIVNPQTQEKYINTKPIKNTNAEPCRTDESAIKADTAKATKPCNITSMNELYQRIRKLEKKNVRATEVVDPNMSLSSSDDENRDAKTRNSVSKRAGCSYIEHYSHIPETGAFQRRARQACPLTPSKGTTIEKEHNSEQYGRDFTTYDGITARGRRHSATVSGKREDGPRGAAERVHKMRHKLNPVRDYRLMDTVHYLAQGEFAPRDDGIKLTPSREAVLSDIIYEDVCRTHWPNTRLNQRQRERDRRGHELQRLIDSMLRDRVAHVERRRRRHYHIVKLNHRHDSCTRPLGKTGDIIVASHKHKSDGTERDAAASDRTVDPSRRWTETMCHRRSVRSNRESSKNYEVHRHPLPDPSGPGPSNAVCNSVDQNTDCYYHSYLPDNPEREQPVTVLCTATSAFASDSSVTRPRRSARLLVKKEPPVTSRRRAALEEPNLEQFILLPTLVLRTQSNLKRQKKFNKLYHRILSTEERERDESQVYRNAGEPTDPEPKRKVQTRDIGLNINVNEDDLNRPCYD